MKLCILFTIPFAMIATLSNAQSTASNDTNTSSNNANLQQQPMDKPAGLPNVEWTVLQIDPDARENLCLRQTAYCSNNCGGPNEAVKNFCNSTSMAWGCGCSKKTTEFAPYSWPIVQAECSGKLQDCQKTCYVDRAHLATCATTCNAYYQCGSDRAPPSYLQTDYPTDTPSYDGLPKTINATSNNNSTSANSTETSNKKSSNAASFIANHSQLGYLIITFVSTVTAAVMNQLIL